MSIVVAEGRLPEELTTEQAVEAAYAAELAEAASKLARGLPVLVECDKDLAPFLFLGLRPRLKQAGLQCLYLDGRPRAQDQGPCTRACEASAATVTSISDGKRSQAIRSRACRRSSMAWKAAAWLRLA